MDIVHRATPLNHVASNVPLFVDFGAHGDGRGLTGHARVVLAVPQLRFCDDFPRSPRHQTSFPRLLRWYRTGGILSEHE